MHPDRKIGIAMGILLVGVVAALFFRNEPLPVDDSLTVRRENELNERLRERDVAIYMDREEVTEEASVEPDWALSDVLGVRRSTDEALPIKVTEAEPVPPIRVFSQPPLFEPPKSRMSATPNAKPEEQELITDVRQPPEDIVEESAKSDVAAPTAASRGFDEYKIQYGDTLSGISKRFLGSHQRYSEIYNANKDRINNPDRLRVGTAIRIPRAIH